MLLHETLTRELQSSDVSSANSWKGRLGTVAALCALLVIDAWMKLAGFHRFYRLIKNFPTLGRSEASDGRIASICQAVDRATALYFKRAWCLQRSATAVCLLRLRGVPAELVLGACKMPFYGHAWAELEGRVLNDSPVVQDRYKVLERC